MPKIFCSLLGPFPLANSDMFHRSIIYTISIFFRVFKNSCLNENDETFSTNTPDKIAHLYKNLPGGKLSDG